jgi:hypothetical protein
MRQCIVTYPSSEVDNRTTKDQQERYTGDAMDASQVVAHINWLAVAVSGVAGFPLGALWYGSLFGSAWMAATGITRERARQAYN